MSRTIESYQHHIDTTVAHCHRSWLVLRRTTLLGDEYLVTPHLCQSNYCSVCRPRNLVKLRKMLYESLKHHRWRLITLTFPDHSQDVLEQLKNLYRQFKRFIQRVRRIYPDLAFVRTIEIHQSGYPHIHMIVDSYIPVSFVQKHWHDVGGGFVSIRNKKRGERTSYVYTHKDAAHYLTDELEKANQDPHKLGHVFWQASCRAITTSRNLKLSAGSGEWSFYRVAKDLTDAMYQYEEALQLSRWNSTPTPSIHYGADAVKIGYGFSD